MVSPLPSKAPESALNTSKRLGAKLSQLKKQIQAIRLISIKEMVDGNRTNLRVQTSQLLEAAKAMASSASVAENILSVRVRSPLCKLGGWELAAGWGGEKEMGHGQEEIASSGTVVFGSSLGGKTAVRLVKLPYVEKIPPYTTWMFLNRNQRMSEDQSVVGRRQIYYDPYGNETIICSDSEEENAEPGEEKHEFSEGEDQILWKILQEEGRNQEVLDIVSQSIEASPSDIEDRYEVLMEKYQEKQMKKPEDSSEPESEQREFLNKTLSAALDSFDNLFCRRCLVFDCHLHGCSQSLIIPSERHAYGSELDENRSPCGDHCYLMRKIFNARVSDIAATSSFCGKGSITSIEKTDTYRDSDMQNTGDTVNLDTAIIEDSLKNMGNQRVLNSRIGHALLEASPLSVMDPSCTDSGAADIHEFGREASCGSMEDPSGTDSCRANTTEDVGKSVEAPKARNTSTLPREQSSVGWSTIEKDLYQKGVEIFGKNSCLIARNLLSGLKSCVEVSNYMFCDGVALPSGSMLTDYCLEDSECADHGYKEQDTVPRTRIWRRRGRARKLKYTWKSAGHPSIRKRIGDGKQQSCRQYNPCGCEPICGKQCPCMQNGTCCEKYCGCSKSCKNRFRGCHCAKSQCRSRQCPCFAAGRECDPDVCRNCWVSCGDGSLGEPPARGDVYQCGNMKLLLKQQQRILLGRSDIAGWGAFIKNPVNKNEYLGEYTGELVSHKEADKRGKIYDRANSSFLFDLNDQCVLDAYRKGDKLKFANHSSNPKCYAKVMLVAGDHRVGIYAKEHIEASEELFYDYRYGPNQAPAWARKPEGSKRDDSSVSHKRAHKVA